MRRLGLILTLLLAFPAFSNTILKATAKGVLIQLSSPEEFSVGDRAFALDENGKRKGLLTIQRISKGRAIAVISKGQAKANWTVAKAGSRGSGENSRTASKSSSDQKPFALGVLAGAGINNMTVKVTTASGTFVEELNMSGSGFSFKAFADYDFTSFLGIRLLVGLEQFSASATPSNSASCGGGKCKTDIGYITFDGWLRYSIVEKSPKVWLGAGVGALAPGSKTTNALDPNSINTTIAFYVGGGADFGLDGDWYIPTQVDYAFLPGSDQVKASIIGIRVGVGTRF